MHYLLWIFLILNTPYQLRATTYGEKIDSARKSEKYCNQLISVLEKEKTSLALGYLGVAYMLKANHCVLPWNKLIHFKKGKRYLEKAIMLNADNIELRLYRYEIQRRIPGVLQYNNIFQDREALKTYLKNPRNRDSNMELYDKIKELCI